MHVLESPITWIGLAAVLVVVALLLFLVAALRRRRARRGGGRRRAAAAGDRAGPRGADREHPADRDRAGDGTPSTSTRGQRGRRRGTSGLRRRVGRDASPPPRRERRARRRGQPVPDTGSAKDRLLAVLLHDPRGAVAALTTADRDTGSSAAALLRAGLTPAQVARLAGVEEHHLATVVAQGPGLLTPAQGSGGATGENRTVDPGRSWANAASSAGSTTPTTG